MKLSELFVNVWAKIARTRDGGFSNSRSVRGAPRIQSVDALGGAIMYMQELPESVGRMVESMYEELIHIQLAASADLLPNATTRMGPCRYLYERNGRHEETRTPDLYRVKVAL